jgi:CRP-like cAMP-binding protein
MPAAHQQIILSNISRHIQLTATEEARFLEVLVLKTIKRKQFLLHAQEVARYVAFVTKGCLRGYTIDHNGFEHILQFAPEDWWITDMYSFISQHEGELNIDAIEDTEVLLLSRKDQLQLFDDIPRFERFFRIITEKSMVSSRKRLIDNLSLTAEERYNTFCNYYPTLINSIAQKQIAAYIGVTPEFLSKMKAELNRKK